MKSDQMGTRTAHPSPQDLPLSNWTGFNMRGDKRRLIMSDDHNPSRDDPTPNKSAMDPTAEGARARAQGTPREACPYAQNSEEFHEWVEGYDGMSVEGSPLALEVKN